MTTVIFACVHNAGRSQMAAALFNALADPAKARAISAGTNPGERVHPEVVDVMQEAGIDLAAARPQRLTPELAAGAQLLVTMGCGDECPYVPGLRRDDWPLEDPKGKPTARVREIRDEIHGRVRTLLTREGWGVPVAVRRARPADLATIEALLTEAHLPLDGARAAFDRGFVAERGGRLVGAAGMEGFAGAALLRSVVVRPDARGEGLGQRLTQAVLDEARALGLPAVYLLTTTAADFFPRLGFTPVERASVPAPVQASIEFQSACPASAAVLVRPLV